MIISQIVAVSKNFIIGKNNRLPWKMPADAKYFHDITMGHAVIMGRKNYQANRKALPGRTNIVISRSKDFNPTDAKVVSSLEEALEYAENICEEECFIVGGGEIYRLSLDVCDRIYITVIDREYEGDTSYPSINFNDYKLISKRTFKADKNNPANWVYWILGKK